MEFDKNLLKSTPEYEKYSENEVKLTKKELVDLGIIKCKGCCCNSKLTIKKTVK